MTSPFGVLKSQGWSQSTAIAPIIDESQAIEEEKTPHYEPKRFYPTRLGEVLKG